MATQTFTFSPGLYQLTPVQNPQDARMKAAGFGASLTIAKGQAVALKASDNLMYPLNAAVTGVTSGTNEVQTLTFGAAATGGTMRLIIPKTDGTTAITDAITWNGTDATWLASINTALDGAGVASGIVATGAAPDTALTFTFSGTGYAGLSWPLIQVHTFPTSATTANVVRTTTGGITTGLQLFKGFAAMSFKTDANGKVYYGTEVSAAHPYAMPQSTAPIFESGTFDPQDLTTRQTPVAQVDTITPTNPTTGDVYTITFTYPDLTTLAISVTVGATQTATATVTLLKAALAASAAASAIVTATGTATLILTSAVAGNTFTETPTVVGTGTVAKASTTAATGRVLADILAGAPGARVTVEGYWLLPS